MDPTQPDNTLPLMQPQEDTSQQLPLMTPPPAPPPTSAEAENRANQYAFATGGDPQSMYQQILAGREADLRRETARQEGIKADSQRVGILQDYASARSKAGVTTPLNDAERQTLEGLTYKQTRDPETIMEDLFAKQAVSTLYPEGSSRTQAADADLHTTMATQDVFQEQIATNAAANRLLSGALDSQNKKGVVQQGLDVVGQMVPFFSQINRHDATQGVSGDFWTSSDLQSQYAHIRNQPTVEAQVKMLTDSYNTIAKHNQLDAINFLQGFLHYGTQEQFLDSALNVADIATVVSPVAKAVGKGVMRVISAPRLSGQEAADLATNVARVNATADKELADLASAAKGAAKLEDVAQADKMSAEIEQRRQDELRKLETFKQERLAEKAPANDPQAAAARFANSAKDTIAALAANPKPKISDIAAAAGNLDLSAASRVFEMASNGVRASDPVHLGTELRATAASIFNPPRAMGIDKPFALAREYVGNIAERMMQNSADFFKAVTGLGPSTISPKALLEAFALGRQRLLSDMERAHLSDSVIDVDHVFMPEQTQGNVGYNILRLGKPGGVMFDNQHQAGAWLKEYGIAGTVERGNGPTWKVVQTENLKNVASGIAKKTEGASVVASKEKPGKFDIVIKQQGEGHYIQIARPAKETDDATKGFLVETNNVTPMSSIKQWLDSRGLLGFMTPSNRLSTEQRGLRTSILYRIAEVQKLIGTTWTSAIGPLDKAEKLRSTRFFDMMRRQEWVAEDGTRMKGVEFKSQHDFENQWLATWKQLPNEKESMAYWGYIQANQMQYYVDNLRTYSERARQGSMLWQFAKGQPWLEGRLERDVNKVFRPDANWSVIRADGKEDVYQGSKAYKDGELKDEITNLVKNEGHQIVQMADPRRPGHAPVHFVVTKDATQKNLTMDLIPYKGGGHIVYDYPGYVKQAVAEFGRGDYVFHYGDNTVLPVTSAAEGGVHVATLERARELYRNGDRAGFDAHIGMKPPFTSDALWNKFANGTLRTDLPFVYTRAGESTYHTPEMQRVLSTEKTSIDWANSDLNYLKGMNRQWFGHRGWDVQGIQQMADETGPIFSFEKPRLIDPLPTLNQAINQSIRNKFFGAYQLRTAEHFVEEFKSVLQDGLRADELARLRENPLRALYNPKWDVNVANRPLLAAARGYQNAALNLLGTTTDIQRQTKWVEAKLMDMVYNKFGNKAADLTYEVLQKIPDPVKYGRQLAFSLKLGLFNPVQLLLQAQTAATSMAILGPTHGFKGFAAAGVARMLHVSDTPANIEHFAKIASNFGWKAEDFKEAYDFMIRAGTFNVGSSHAWRWDAADMNYISKAGGRFLDKGNWFFNEGNRFPQLVSHMGAYAEWRTANPFAKLTQEAETNIMSRYDDLTINMTHHSSSALNRGIGAVAGQFLSYQERLAELLLGKRLTPVEKLRVFAVNSAMYGIPTAVGAWTAGVEQPIMQGLAAMGAPVPADLRNGSAYEDVRGWLLKQHPEIKNNAWIESLTEGVPELMLHVATGSQFNVAARLGPGGMNGLFDDISRGTNPFVILAGPQGNVMGDATRAVYPVIADLANIIHGQGVRPILVPDVVDTISNASGVNNLMKAYYGLTLGRYFTANHAVVANDINPTESIFMGILGLTPSRLNDRMIMDQAVKGKADAQLYARNEAMKYIRMWQQEKDASLSKDYGDRINFWFEAGGFTSEERGQIAAKAMGEANSQVETSTRAFNKAFPQGQH